MKMKRNNKTDARPGEKSARSFRRSFGMVALSVFAAVAVALFGAAPAFAVSLGAPTHTKTATLDPATGKIKITLDVTGNTGTGQSKSSANLIVVLDTSNSMKEYVGYGYKYVEDDYSGNYGVVDGKYVQLSVEHDWWYDAYYYTDANGKRVEYTGQRYSYRNVRMTRLDVAKQALSSLADQLISSSDSTVKIALETFSGYGSEVSSYYGAGQADTFKSLVNSTTASGGTNWADALDKANVKANEDTATPTYIVFLSDGKPTYGMQNGSRRGDGSENQSSSRLASFVTDAVNTANNRPNNVFGFYAIYTGSDAASAMNSFASRTNASPNKAAINGSDSTALNDAFSNIVKTINEGISYTNVKITDYNSDAVSYVTPAGSNEPTFTYTKGGQAWNIPADLAAHVVDGHVEWNLGKTVLEKDVKYSVSFEVKLEQLAYDNAAPADGQTPVSEVETNKAASLAYSTVVKKGDDSTTTDQGSVPYNMPSVAVPTSKLAITKTWVGDGVKPDTLTLKVKQDGKDYKTVTMTKADADADGNWTKTVDVATGLNNGKGHQYSIEEVVPDGWTETTPAAGVKFKNLFKETSAQSITNTYKTGNLKLKKKITGNAANPNGSFTFELSCLKLKGKTFKDGSNSTTFNDKGVATVTLSNNEVRTLSNVPAGSEITITEKDDSGTNGTNVTASTEATVGDKVTKFESGKAKTVTATVADDDTTTVVTYTNKFEAAPPTGISLSSGPQVALLGVAMAGVLGLVIYSVRKNHGREE